MLARLRQSSAFQFVVGTTAGLAVAAAGYLVVDTISDAITLRECQKLVLPLAVQHQELSEELGLPISVGPMYSSSLRVSPTGRTIQCMFRLDGPKRSSEVSATVQRTSYGWTAVHNLLGPGTWSLANCHVLIGVTNPLLILQWRAC